MSAEKWDKEVLLERFLSTIAVPSWDLLATTTLARDCCIESQVALSSFYVPTALEYRKPVSASTANIVFFEALAYPTAQSEVGERDIVCILQLAEVKANDKVRKYKEELTVVAKTEIYVLGKNERISLPNILAFLLAEK